MRYPRQVSRTVDRELSSESEFDDRKSQPESELDDRESQPESELDDRESWLVARMYRETLGLLIVNILPRRKYCDEPP